MKYLTQHSKLDDFFKGLREEEVFMYSYHDFKWEDIIKLAKQYKLEVEYIEKGSEEYKKYGEYAVKVINMKANLFSFKIDSKEEIEIESQSEESARLRLLDILFNKGYIKLEKAIIIER